MTKSKGSKLALPMALTGTHDMNSSRTIASVQTTADPHGAGEVAELDLSTLLIEAEAGGGGLLILPSPEHAANSVLVEIPAAVVRAGKARASEGAP